MSKNENYVILKISKIVFQSFTVNINHNLCFHLAFNMDNIY